MNLDGEHLARIEEFEQQREPEEVPSQFSQQLLRPLLDQLPNGPSFERSIRDKTGKVITVAQQPSLSDRAVAGQRLGKYVGQTPSTPESILIDRFESQWIQRYWVHGILFTLIRHQRSPTSQTRKVRRAARCSRLPTCGPHYSESPVPPFANPELHGLRCGLVAHIFHRHAWRSVASRRSASWF